MLSVLNLYNRTYSNGTFFLCIIFNSTAWVEVLQYEQKNGFMIMRPF